MAARILSKDRSRALDDASAGDVSVAGRRKVRWLALALGAALLLPAVALAQKHKDVEKIGQRDINKGSWNLYSLEREFEIGRSLASQVESSSRLLADPYVQNYMEDLVGRLVRNSDAQAPFTVRVIDSDELNAFALPGGFLYVNTGLLLEAETEAELAGILAHEIAHVTARHATKQASKARLVQLFSLPLVFVGGPVAMGVSQALNVALPLTFLKFRRNAEREADFLGLQYTYRAGYDPAALIDFLERLNEKEYEPRVPGIFSTHPMNLDRIQRARKEMAEVLAERPDYVVTTSRFDLLRDHLRQLQQAEGHFEPGEENGPRLRRRTAESDDSWR
jgi:predicted Zn-dependent protease